MKTRYLLYSLVLFVALLQTACSPQVGSIEGMSEEMEMASETPSKTMEENDDDMMAEDETMSDEKADVSGSDLSDHDNGDMAEDEMEEKDDDAIMDDIDDEMDDSNIDGMIDVNDNDDMSGEKEDEMPDDSMIMTPDWFDVSLTDVNTGETFEVADFNGKVVLVETLAMWCSNCLKQQGQVQILHELVGERDDFISVGLDIDPNERSDALKSYTNNNGFDWVYAIAPAEVSHDIGQLYGDQYLNPPSTPMLIIDREGEVHPLPFGIKSTEDLFKAVMTFLDV